MHAMLCGQKNATTSINDYAASAIGMRDEYEEEDEYYVNTRNTARNTRKVSPCESFLAEETISSVEALAQCRL